MAVRTRTFAAGAAVEASGAKAGYGVASRARAFVGADIGHG